ncbi:hypothetical protein DFH28DRAFT_964078 [Melampsora americana]|nr:hypothetical protein DFH28DRAFT_964078 [Melampsora americana]
MSEIVYVESISDDERSDCVESDPKGGLNEIIEVSTQEIKKIKESKKLMSLPSLDEKEKARLEEIEALSRCKEYWKDIAQIRLKNLETINVALESQAKRIYELEQSISDNQAEERRVKKARFSTCKPQLGSRSSSVIKYGVIVHGIPTSMNLASTEVIKSFQDENYGLLDSLVSIDWVNPRSLYEGKLTSSIVIYLSDSSDYEMLLKQSCVLYGSRAKAVKRFVSNHQNGKTQCFKCEGIGHLARDCVQVKDVTEVVEGQRES